MYPVRGMTRRARVVRNKDLYRVTCFIAMITCVIVSSCKSRRLSRVVIYDQEWSRAAAIANLVCDPTTRDACRREAQSDEITFSQNLAATFQTSQECKDIRFAMDESNSSQEKDGHLLDMLRAPHWRLRVNYHPRLSAQSFTLDLVHVRFRDSSKWGGEGEAVEIANFVCEMSRKNGVVDYW